MQFNRLLGKVDELVRERKLEGRAFGQAGNSTYAPKNYPSERFLDFDEFKRRMKEADLVITHGGEGVIGTGLQMGKKMIIVPRLKRFGEHTNDHQLELTRAVANSQRAIAVYNINEMEKALEKVKNFRLKSFSGQGQIISIIEGFLKGLEK